MWPTHVTDPVYEKIVLSGVMNFRETRKLAKLMPKDVDGRSLPVFLLKCKTSSNREHGLLRVLPTKPSTAFHVSNFLKGKTNKLCGILAKSEGYLPTVQKWHKLYNKLPEHEKSTEHKTCCCWWKELEQSLSGRVDSEIQKQALTEASRWRAILERMLDII